MNAHLRTPRRRGAAGFSLVELMVGLVIGMIAIFVMMQVFQAAESYKRTAVGGSDAQTSGAIALDGLTRTVANAGYGIANDMFLSCALQLPGGVLLNNAGTVTINHPQIPAGAPGTDTILVVSGSNSTLSEGDWVNGVTGTVLSVSTALLHQQGDSVVFAENQTPAGPCSSGAMTMQTVMQPPATPIVTVANNIVPGGSGTGMLINLGLRPRVVGYAVRNGSLTMCDFVVSNCSGGANDTTVWVPIEPNVVSLVAEYGRDTTVVSDGAIDVYDRTQPATACDWLRIAALRLAVVTRSEQFEKTDVTGVAGGAPAPTWRGAVPIDLTNYPSWQRYRYRVYQATVPLRTIAIVAARNIQSGDSACP